MGETSPGAEHSDVGEEGAQGRALGDVDFQKPAEEPGRKKISQVSGT